MAAKTIEEIGEKALIRNLIKPLLNPDNRPDLVGDDCAVIQTGGDTAVVVSTDRVPADLVSFKLGIIDYQGLGYYLAILNLSDIAAMGAEPKGLLLNLGLPNDLSVDVLEKIISGAAKACRQYGCEIIGGDLSSASELSISATSIGTCSYVRLLRRCGAKPNDLIYCTGVVGLAATAFRYFLDAKPKGMQLSFASEQLLKDQFQKPTPKFDAGRLLHQFGPLVTCMDNTDGVGQTLSEICEINGLGAILDARGIPLHDVSREVADYLRSDVYDIILGPGADFNLIGTIVKETRHEIENRHEISIIGRITQEAGIQLELDGNRRNVLVQGWNYYTAPMRDLAEGAV